MLGAKMKARVRKGIGITKRQAEIISEEQEDILLDKSILGEDSPYKPVDTLVDLLGLTSPLEQETNTRYFELVKIL